MTETIFDIMDRFGYLGVFLLIAIENIFPPIPSEIILTFGGFMTTYTSINLVGVVLAATAGSVVGAIILYFIGCILSIDRLEKLFESKLGKLLRLKKEDVKSAEKWFSKHGNKAVFFCRFVPIVRSLISIPAGIAKMSLLPFMGLTFAGSLIWNTVLVSLGRIAGDTWKVMLEYLDIYKLIAVVIIGIICAVIGFLFIKKRFIDPIRHK